MRFFGSLRTFMVTAVVLISLPALAGAAMINGVGIHSVSSSYPTMPATLMVDGSGLDMGNNPPTHSSTDWGSSWETLPAHSLSWIVFDLGADYTVDAFRVWNFNLVNPNGSYTGRGAKDVNIFTSADSNLWNYQGAYQFPIAPGLDSYAGDLFSIASPWVGAHYVKIDILSIYGIGDHGGHAGLSEIRFYGNGAGSNAVPEPGTLLLLGFGLIGLAGVRRKIKK